MDAVSVRDIAAACAMKASNLYAHFPSKEALVARCSTRATPSTARCWPRPPRVRAVPRRLERMVRAICRLHDEDNVRFRFLVMTQHSYLKDVAHDERNPVEVICRAFEAPWRPGKSRAASPNSWRWR